MPAELQTLTREEAPAVGAVNVLTPKDDGFADAFSALLVREGLVDPGAVARARRASEAASERLDIVMVKLGLLSEADLCGAYAAYCGLRVARPSDLPSQPLLADRLKLPFLKSSRALPISASDGSLLLAAVDPFDDEACKAIGYMLGCRVDMAVIAPADIELAFRKLYQDTGTQATGDDHRLAAVGAADGNEIDVERLRDIANEAPIIRLVNQIIAGAVERGASDIHIEPGRDTVLVRFRLDGFLQQERVVPSTLKAALTTRIKIMAKLDIAERRLPQDGRIKTAVRGTEIDVRVSTLPTAFGESLVLRILDRTRVELDFFKLGLDQDIQDGLHRLMALPSGIVLVTGPTGSGKTTTLYTALKELNRPELKLFTVEDPIEYQLGGINQIQVQPQIGLDFPAALRSILRQDPDIIMIGEIRDLETARIAVQASLTGHLVFSTLHTNSAIAAITRLIDIGIERYLLASTLTGVMAQRLVRRLCQHCARPAAYRAEAASRRRWPIPDGVTIDWSGAREAVGCNVCHGTGYLGRTSVSELLVVDDDMREAIGRRSDDQRTMISLARLAGFHTLYEAGLIKVSRGETTIEEVLRVSRSS
ncbi:Flp pilus assembly complex ATPase component TadA [Bradyrhizobium japonicum]|uniref:GspE/PulE family protein n=1 Tax=Bradyrhizobium japonicum TaxID=375 RepID=UPI001BAAF96E|nr:ATPase, T2SS/T4P/T4SS family [Bradyrhizobium japonicum]MBR0994299.1 Flp pilus assembly complex ATPase component TadA [Bradyrhizobium japonicum]